MALLDKFRKKTKEKEPEKEKKTVSQKTEKSKEPAKVKTSGKNLAQAYRVIQSPLISEKATFLAQENKYVFKVFSKANKTEVKKAIKMLYGVDVEKVRMVRIPGKKRRVGRYQGWRKGLKRGFKKAIVQLREGEKIEVQ